MNVFRLINSFTPTDCFSSIQNNEWKSPIKLLSVERVKLSLLQSPLCGTMDNNVSTEIIINSKSISIKQSITYSTLII